MTGAWVNGDGYNPGRRHYHPDATVTEVLKPSWRDGWQRAVLTMGPALCPYGRTEAEVSVSPEGKRYLKGFSIKPQVNLMQRNLCSVCVSRFIKEVRPDLADAYNALKKGVVQT